MADKDNYSPRGKTAVILDRAYALAQSVPYKVSARWLFYRLLQEGHYSSKDDYKNKFLPAVSSARHAFYRDWRPDTLADETRSAITRGNGFLSPDGWLRALALNASCHLDKWASQAYYVELWYEARAMTDQFRYYTEHITLRPMGGQPSIPYKWDTAKDLEWAAHRYGTPIAVLYFGDLDNAGGMIADTAEADVSKWCSEPFEFIRCGLTLDQVQRYGVPENPEKPGEYQWEALPDDAARAIIESNVAPFISHAGFTATVDRESAVTAWLREQIARLELPPDLVA